jgi:hypothetical protein
MTKHKTLPPEPSPKRRSDYGTFKTSPRDWDGWELLGSMRWVRADTLGELWDPERQPALVQSPQEQLQEPDLEPKKGRGGKRTGLPWPQEPTARMNATLRIVYKWEVAPKRQGWIRTGIQAILWVAAARGHSSLSKATRRATTEVALRRTQLIPCRFMRRLISRATVRSMRPLPTG